MTKLQELEDSQTVYSGFVKTAAPVW
jgi:hypothetical protein